MARADDKLKEKLNSIIFGTDTTVGKAFDIILILIIISNSILIIAESVDRIKSSYQFWIVLLGWIFIVIFIIEYLLRLYIVKSKIAYIFSFLAL